jgi:predicted DNA-binding transcriptional regulator YafY
MSKTKNMDFVKRVDSNRDKKTHDKSGKEKMVRVLKVLTALDHGTIILKELAQDMGLSVRTLQRYVRVLESAGFPLYNNPKIGEWAFVEGYSLKKMQFSKDEACLLVLMDDWVSSLANKKLAQAFLDLKNKISGNVVDTPFYIKENEVAAYEVSPETKSLEAAIDKKEVIDIGYFSDWDNKTKSLKSLKPMKIVCYDGFWYLIALGYKNKILKFRISNIKSVLCKDKYFSHDGKIEKTLRESKNIWFEAERNIEVKLLIKKEGARYFKKKKYFPAQNIEADNPDGSFILTCKIANDQEIVPTILHWIPFIKTISPENLATAIKEKIKNYLNEL